MCMCIWMYLCLGNGCLVYVLSQYLLDPQLLFSYPLSTDLLSSALTLLDPQHLDMLTRQLLTNP